MVRRVKRLRDFEINLEIKNDNFIRPPRDSQRNWLLKQALSEHADNLIALDAIAQTFVRGGEPIPFEDRTQASLGDDEIMEPWQIPLMEALTHVVTEDHGDVLEIGFGLGIAADFIQGSGVRSHTIIECNDSVITRFEQWKQKYPDRDIRIVPGKWQDVLPDLGSFEGLLFHTFPLNEEEFIEQIAESTTFAEHFFSHAAAHLTDGGAFTYLSNEIDSLSRTHQRSLFQHFSSINLQIMHDLPVPEDVRDAWWSKSMVVVKATK